MQRVINLQSDTCTLPTDEMRKAMYDSVVGDDVEEMDPTVKRLETLAASIVGKEASLFVSSGTMGNLLALMTHCAPGREVILEAESHIYYYEVGGISRIAGLVPKQVNGKNGIMDPADIEKAFREDNLHYPETGLICLESSHNRGGGTVIPLENMRAVFAIAKAHNVPVHLDGARLFNAALALNVDPKEIVSSVDSVQFCLSKGLSAPVGSMLCGTKDFIKKARKNRKMLGGGLRQSGVIAAPGIVALEKMIPRLAEDHANAKRIAAGLAEIPGISLDLDTVQTNMVIFGVEGFQASSDEFCTKLENSYHIKTSPRPPHRVRMVTNRHIGAEDVEYIVASVEGTARQFLSGK